MVVMVGGEWSKARGNDGPAELDWMQSIHAGGAEQTSLGIGCLIC